MLPPKPHPIVAAFVDSLQKSSQKCNAIEKNQSLQLRKVSRVLGWRNRHSQSDFYPVELLKGTSKVKFQVRQVQRGEIENSYGTGSTVWPASLVLLQFIQHLVANSHDRLRKMTGKNEGEPLNIVELGAGTGVASIAAAKIFDNSFVICTDGTQKVVDLAQENVKSSANDGSTLGSKGYLVGNSNILVCKYWWGDGTILKRLQSLEKGDARFDLILISDCILPKLYPIEPLVQALDECMSSQTVAYCTYEHRHYPKYGPKEHFIELAAQKRLEVRTVPMEEQHPIYSVDDIEVFEITRTPQ